MKTPIPPIAGPAMSRSSDQSHASTRGPRRSVVWLLIVTVTTAPLTGCKSFFWPSPTISNEHRAYYHRKVAEIDAEIMAAPVYDDVPVYGEPPELRDRLPEERLEDEVWPMTLFSAVRLAVEHNKVIRQDGQFLSTNNPLFASIEANSSVYDPYIQDTNISFGNRGIGAAMADFNTQLSASMQWGKDDQFNNVAGATGGFTDDTRQFALRLEKQLAFGGTLGISQQINFQGTTNPSTGIPHSYSGPLTADISIPLWAASGTEFTQIAGPAAFLVPRVTSVNQGVLISQINSEIARIDFEAAVRSLSRDVVNLYWDLDLAYARVRTEQAAADDANAVYDKAVAEFESGRSRAAEEAQSAETYYAAKARLEEALRIYDETERRFRRLLGLPVSDGRMIQPIDEPTLVPVPDDWNGMLAEALARRPQMRRMKHNLRSVQLQLKAARSLVKPRFDYVGSYTNRGFGDRLTGAGDAIPSFGDTFTDGTLTGWTSGVQFSMPLGFQQQRSQVNNLELRVAKSRTMLAIAENEISHELAVRYQNAHRWTQIVDTNDRRRDAAARLVRTLEADFEYQRGDLDQLVRAQATLAQAEVEYRRALVEFRKALAELDFVRSALLEANSIDLVFPNLPIAGKVRDCGRPDWIDALPMGHHLPDALPARAITSDPAIRPASTGGAEGYSSAVGEVTTRDVGAPLRVPERGDGPSDGNGPNDGNGPSDGDFRSPERGPTDAKPRKDLADEPEGSGVEGPTTPELELALPIDGLPDLSAKANGRGLPANPFEFDALANGPVEAASPDGWDTSTLPRLQPIAVPDDSIQQTSGLALDPFEVDLPTRVSPKTDVKSDANPFALPISTPMPPKH